MRIFDGTRYYRIIHEADGTFTETAVLNELLNGKGQTPDLTLKYRLTVSWDGTELTYERLVQEVSCR